MFPFKLFSSPLPCFQSCKSGYLPSSASWFLLHWSLEIFPCYKYLHVSLGYVLIYLKELWRAWEFSLWTEEMEMLSKISFPSFSHSFIWNKVYKMCSFPYCLSDFITFILVVAFHISLGVSWSRQDSQFQCKAQKTIHQTHHSKGHSCFL